MTDSVRAVVNPEICFSYGRCVDAAPDLFSFGEDGKSVSVGEWRPLVHLLPIAEACPVEAISLIATDGTVQFGPEPVEADQQSINSGE